MTPARKPRTECCCQSVTAIIAAIVAPAGFLSIARTRACFVSGLAVGLDDAVGRFRDVGLVFFRAIDQVEAFGLDLGLFMGSSGICATPFAAPHQPRPDKAPGGAGSRGGNESPQV